MDAELSHESAIAMIDAELTKCIPQMHRKYYREEVTQRIDQLLDMRNELVYQMGLVVLERELELIEMESIAYILDGTT